MSKRSLNNGLQHTYSKFFGVKRKCQKSEREYVSEMVNIVPLFWTSSLYAKPIWCTYMYVVAHSSSSVLTSGRRSMVQ